jgi:biotin carboxyl carrier protein
MKLQAEIGDKRHEIELSRTGETVNAVIDGRSYDVEVSEPEPGVYLIKNGGKVYEAYVAPTSRLDQPKKVTIRGREFEVRLIDPKRLRGFAGVGEHADGLAEIKTAMPGKVVRVLLEPGVAVEKGGGVLVVEAMKMQNELRSPKAGTVKEVRVSEGDTVSAGDILATIE